jgi:hypothetical protein
LFLARRDRHPHRVGPVRHQGVFSQVPRKERGGETEPLTKTSAPLPVTRFGGRLRFYYRDLPPKPGGKNVKMVKMAPRLSSTVSVAGSALSRGRP